ncbi:MAG: urtB [Devosia sp.]|nr:urtB [Devosia sp.]
MNAARLLQRIALFLVLSLTIAIPAHAQVADSDLSPLVDALAPGNFKDREAAIGVLVSTEDPRVVPILEVLLEGELYFDDATGKVVFTSAPSGKGTITDPLTGAELPAITEDGLDKVKVNNGLRRVIRTAIGQMTLLSDDAGVRRFAAESILRDADPAQLELLDSAIAAETDPSIKQVMDQARAVIMLKTPDATVADKTAAVPVVQAIGGRDALNVLTTAFASAPAELQPTIQTAINGLARDRAVWDVAQNIWFGISLGSVLLLAAIGLAITFGVMGVINMAHGEMVMLGAYTTFVVQEIIRQNYPGLFDWSLAIALPLAFLVTGLIGIAIERGIIRFLYGRPLETLLATWGISLIIQQSVQRIFSANIREVGNPTWMSGSFELGGLAITWNRFYIVIFAIIVFLSLLMVLKYTAIGLHMRAVTQNRRMASAMGIRTPLVDAMTFGLGSGIAGLAGVALSQIGNVSPNLGQGYIIDSFMVVVFGGVGNLWGTLVGALTLGIANKFIEPYAGAVLGKIIILVLIILFIQRRPRGLFALKGRSIEA